MYTLGMTDRSDHNTRSFWTPSRGISLLRNLFVVTAKTFDRVGRVSLIGPRLGKWLFIARSVNLRVECASIKSLFLTLNSHCLLFSPLLSDKTLLSMKTCQLLLFCLILSASIGSIQLKKSSNPPAPSSDAAGSDPKTVQITDEVMAATGGGGKLGTIPT